MAAQQLVRKFHRVHVPLSFWQDTGHTCDIKATQRLIGHICKTSVPEVLATPAQSIPISSTVPFLIKHVCHMPSWISLVYPSGPLDTVHASLLHCLQRTGARTPYVREDRKLPSKMQS